MKRPISAARSREEAGKRFNYSDLRRQNGLQAGMSEFGTNTVCRDVRFTAVFRRVSGNSVDESLAARSKERRRRAFALSTYGL
jgi:hypothetical protein